MARARCFVANSECWGCLETRRVRYLAWSYTPETTHCTAVPFSKCWGQISKKTCNIELCLEIWVEQVDFWNLVFRPTGDSQPQWEFLITTQTLAKIFATFPHLYRFIHSCCLSLVDLSRPVHLQEPEVGGESNLGTAQWPLSDPKKVNRGESANSPLAGLESRYEPSICIWFFSHICISICICKCMCEYIYISLCWLLFYLHFEWHKFIWHDYVLDNSSDDSVSWKCMTHVQANSHNQNGPHPTSPELTTHDAQLGGWFYFTQIIWAFDLKF